MRGDAAGDVDAEGGDFGVGVGPDAGQSRDAFRRNLKIGAAPDQYFLQAPDVLDGAKRFASSVVRRKATQIKNGISDQLSRAVKGNVAAAIAFEDLDAPLGEELGRGQNVLGLRVAAKSNDRRVLQEKNNVSDASFFAQPNQLFLQALSGGVINGAELENGDQKLARGFSQVNADAKPLHHRDSESQRNHWFYPC